MKKVASTAVTTVMAGAVLLTMTQSADAATTIGGKALKTAAAQKGDPYKDAAEGPNAFDCSGLTYYSFKKNGKKIPRTAQGQYNKATKVSASKRTKGDLVFFGTSKTKIKHVGIYAGGGKIWNANSGNYRGFKVVLAPIGEYDTNGKKVYYARFTD